MVIPMAAAGDNSCVWAATAISWKPWARRFTAKQGDPDKLVWAIAALAEGLGIRAVARVFEADPNTVLGWLVEAAEHLETFSHDFLRDFYVEQVPMDELFALLSAVKDGEVTEAEAITRLSRSPHWVWVAMDPFCKLILTVDVGERTLAMARRLRSFASRGVAAGLRPAAAGDGFPGVSTALVTHYGQWMQPEDQRPKGPSPSHDGCRGPCSSMPRSSSPIGVDGIVGVTHRVIFGAAGDHRVDPGQARVDDQYQLCRAPESGLSPACGADLASREHVMQTRSGIASATGSLSGLPQFRVASYELAVAPARAHRGRRAQISSGSRGRPRWPPG